MWSELARSFQNGNFYLLLMTGLAFVALLLIFERFIMLQFVYNIDFKRFLNNFRKMVSSEDMDRAMNLCRSVSKTSLPNIALAALEASENDPTTVKGTIEEGTIEFLPKIESRINFMPNIATIILLIGILGTIDSLWDAFHTVDVLDTAKKQASLANGIAASLNPTALGLIICMFILFSHQILKGMANKILEHIHHGVTVLYNLLVPPEVSFVSAEPTTKPAKVHFDEDVSDKQTEIAETDDNLGAEDAFDDASVEDIKDEEEII